MISGLTICRIVPQDKKQLQSRQVVLVVVQEQEAQFLTLPFLSLLTLSLEHPPSRPDTPHENTRGKATNIDLQDTILDIVSNLWYNNLLFPLFPIPGENRPPLRFYRILYQIHLGRVNNHQSKMGE